MAALPRSNRPDPRPSAATVEGNPPSTVTPHPTLRAITGAAVDATGAAGGWLLAVDGDRLVALVTTGPHAAEAAGHVMRTGEGSAGYVLSSGQPLALQPQAGARDPWATEHPLAGRVPRSILAVPCEDAHGVLGVLELVDGSGGPFSYDDVEVVTLLGSIAAAALGEGARHGPAVPLPDELYRALGRVFADDPTLYQRIAVVVQALVADA